MAKLNFKQMAISYFNLTFASVTVGFVAGYLWQRLGGQADYVLIIGVIWLIACGLPSLLVSVDTQRRLLGERKGTTITASGRGPGRSIPVNHNGKSSHVFMSMLPIVGHKFEPGPDPEPIELPEQFTVEICGIGHTLLLTQIEDFLYGSWNRQRRGLSAFSRKYWLTDRRPDRLNRQTYDALMALLLGVNGLIIDRDIRRSGRLVVPPQMGIKAIQGAFSLG